MPVFNRAPKVPLFVEAWSQEFEGRVRQASGKDGRLSVSEASRISTEGAEGSSFQDAATGWLSDHGQKSVSVDKLVAETKAYAERAAAAAAGADGLLSLVDGAELPAHLRRPFFLWRGKPDPLAAPQDPIPALKQGVEAAADGLDYMTETDSRVAFVAAKGLGDAPITPETIVRLLGAQHDTLIDGLYLPPRSGMDRLAGRNGITVRDAREFLDRQVNDADPADPVSQANAAKWGHLRDVLEGQLTDLTLVRFGDINISTFIVGRTATGELAGVLTAGVES